MGEFLSVLIIILLALSILFLFVMIPIKIAKVRNVSGGELTTIKVLSWCGLLIGITWVIALILALVYQPSNWVDKGDNSSAGVTKRENKSLDSLEKLYSLKEKGALTEEEFQTQKNKILNL